MRNAMMGKAARSSDKLVDAAEGLRRPTLDLVGWQCTKLLHSTQPTLGTGGFGVVNVYLGTPIHPRSHVCLTGQGDDGSRVGPAGNRFQEDCRSFEQAELSPTQL